MFGRIRAPPSPAEWLELERPHPKLLKDDSLSIFEATLAKLRQGSLCSLSSEHNLSPTSMDFESSASVSEDSSKVSGLCSKQGSPASTCGSDSSCATLSPNTNQEQKRGREVTIQYLFAKYAGSHTKQGSTDRANGSSTSVSACSSDRETTGCSELQALGSE